MRALAASLFATALLLSVSARVGRAEAGKPLPSLAGVAWDGAGASLEDLKGKTVIVMTYVTWCPICNGWAPEMLSQVQRQTEGKPVVVLAVSTDVAPAAAKEYMASKGFVGPNILHGSDPQLARTFGFENKFFNYAIVGPAGEPLSSGNAGSFFVGNNGEPKRFVLPGEIEKVSERGKFRFVDPKMSADLQQLLWPMELGYISEVQRSLKKSEKLLSPTDREKLKTSMNRFLDEEMETAQDLAAGDPAQKIEALDKASFLANSFKAAPQGQQAKKLLGELNKDKNLKKEIGAKRMYEKSMQVSDPDRRVVMLEKAAKQFPDTHFGALAEKAAQAAKR